MSIEKRAYPRFHVKFPVNVQLPDDEDGRLYPAEANTLARTSLEFTCHADLIHALLKQDRMPLTCRVRFKLPQLGHLFDLDAQIFTHRRMSQHQYALVVVFRHDDQAQEELLGNEAENAQIPAPD